MKILILALTVFVSFTALEAKNIMFLGDSITHGSDNYYSYRCDLLPMLGSGYDSIGSQNTGAFGNPSICPNQVDPDHEGHSGWTADQIIAQLPIYLASKKIDIALVHLGTNDVGQGIQAGLDSVTVAKTTASEIAYIIQYLKSTNPSMIILVAGITPTSDSNINSYIENLNQYIAWYATSYSAIYVDQYTGFDASKNLIDGVHPNAAGALEMAKRWYASIGGSSDITGQVSGSVSVSSGQISVSWQPVEGAVSYFYLTSGAAGDNSNGVTDSSNPSFSVKTTAGQDYYVSIFVCKGANATLCSATKTSLGPIRSK